MIYGHPEIVISDLIRYLETPQIHLEFSSDIARLTVCPHLYLIKDESGSCCFYLDKLYLSQILYIVLLYLVLWFIGERDLFITPSLNFRNNDTYSSNIVWETCQNEKLLPFLRVSYTGL